MARAKQAATLKGLLPSVLKQLKTGNRPTAEAMQETWKRLVGEKAASHSWPRQWIRGRVVIEVENSGWMHSLNLRKRKLLEGWIELLGAGWIKEISFRVGEGKETAVN